LSARDLLCPPLLGGGGDLCSDDHARQRSTPGADAKADAKADEAKAKARQEEAETHAKADALEGASSEDVASELDAELDKP